MIRRNWTKLLAVLVIVLPAATTVGQISEAEPAFDLAGDLEAPLDARPVDFNADFDAGDFPASCEYQSPCHECLWCCEYLFGDWHGARSGLAGHGIIADPQLTQFYQGVASGGAVQADAYGGKFDYQFTFLGEPLGLNEGFTTIVHTETRFGEDINNPAGALALPNTNMLWPFPNQSETSITGFLVMQALSEKVVLVGGKINGPDLFNMLYPNTGRGIDGFMNVSFLFPVTLFRTTGLSFNGGGVLAMEGRQIQSGFLVYDTNNSSTTVAPGLFDKGAVVLGYPHEEFA